MLYMCAVSRLLTFTSQNFKHLLLRANAPAGQTGRVAAEEGGALLGGVAGGMAATYVAGGLSLAAVAGATALGFTIAAPVILLGGVAAGIAGAYYGSSFGRDAGSYYFNLLGKRQ